MSVTPNNPATHATRVLLVDNHAAVRDGLTEQIRAIDAVEVIATAATASAAVRLAAQAHEDDTPIDIAVVGRRLADDDDGFELCRRLTANHPGLRCVVHTASEIDAMIALRSGVSAVVLKQLSGNDLIDTIEDLARRQ